MQSNFDVDKKANAGLSNPDPIEVNSGAVLNADMDASRLETAPEAGSGQSTGHSG